MNFSLWCFQLAISLVFGSWVLGRGADDTTSFYKNYDVTWGYDHVLSLDQGRQIQLSLDKSSENHVGDLFPTISRPYSEYRPGYGRPQNEMGLGLVFMPFVSAGFGSKLSFGSGFFHLRIKLPGKDSAGVVTAFYLTSHGNYHDELDFEFLGNGEGKPITLQTNVFANGGGNREQRIYLWFDPTADFHSYKILWNEHHIVFYADDVPIRVFKNHTNIGVSFPSQPMQIEASLWNGDSWATDGGQTKTNWSHAPFKAQFQGFGISGCSEQGSDIQPCYSTKYWWNTQKYWKLDFTQQRAFENVRKNYLNYDYCFDKFRYPTAPPECTQ